MTFDPSNALRSGQGFYSPNLVAIGHSWTIWPLDDFDLSGRDEKLTVPPSSPNPTPVPSFSSVGRSTAERIARQTDKYGKFINIDLETGYGLIYQSSHAETTYLVQGSQQFAVRINFSLSTGINWKQIFWKTWNIIVTRMQQDVFAAGCMAFILG